MLGKIYHNQCFFSSPLILPFLIQSPRVSKAKAYLETIEEWVKDNNGMNWDGKLLPYLNIGGGAKRKVEWE